MSVVSLLYLLVVKLVKWLFVETFPINRHMLYCYFISFLTQNLVYWLWVFYWLTIQKGYMETLGTSLKK